VTEGLKIGDIDPRGVKEYCSTISEKALAISGVLFQYVMKNPLADSFTTGVSASAALGGVLAILLGLGRFLPLLALFTGLLGLLVVYRLASYRGRVQPMTMLLAGIVINTFASALISLFKYLSDDSVSSIVFWLMGGFQWASFPRVVVLALCLAVSLLFLSRKTFALDVLCFDDQTALTTGLRVYHLRRSLFFFATMLTSVSVAYAGIIGFVGLIVPHLLRLCGFLRASELIPLSVLFGAGFMILNDLLARTVLPQGQELPVGIITSALGGFFFLNLLMKKKRELYYFD
jgi:iron complex transport system permease protein